MGFNIMKKKVIIVGADNNATGLVFTIATLASGDGGYPEGGSLAMAGRMAKRFEALGGKIEYSKVVSKVAVNNDKAYGVIVNDELIPSDNVIVTQDTLVAINKLFDKAIEEPWAERMRENTKPMLNTFISLGVEADLSDMPESLNFSIDKPLLCGGVKIYNIGFYNYAAYKGYAPEGCTPITSSIMGDSDDFWRSCKENGTYKEEKQKLVESFISILSEKYPQIAGKVAVWDVATPLTYERYLQSYKGSWMSIMDKGSSMKGYPSKPEKIQNIYFAGQRLMNPGGLPVALDTGRRAVQYLCRDTHTIFKGSK